VGRPHYIAGAQKTGKADETYANGGGKKYFFSLAFSDIPHRCRTIITPAFFHARKIRE